MSVDLKEKLKQFGVKAKPDDKTASGVILPQAFIAKTKVKCGLIPADVDVIAERTFTGNFQLTWWNENDFRFQQEVKPDALDYSAVYTHARELMLAALSDEDLVAEIDRRKIIRSKEARDAAH